MPNKYIVNIQVRDKDNPITVHSIDNIESDNLLHVAHQILFTLLSIQKREFDEDTKKMREELLDDDIPF